MRFDLTVNILTNHAVNKGVITVFGGSQKRPNVHIEDITDLYVDARDPREKIAGETFNAGYENHTVAQLAEIVRVVEEEFPEKAPIKIVTTPSNDNRSYHVSSKKIARGSAANPNTPSRTPSAISAARFRNNAPRQHDDDWNYNVRTVKELGAK